MADKEEFVGLVRTSRGDATVVLATFLLTILADLTIAIAVGVALGALVLLVRMAEAVEVDSGDRLAGAAEAAGNGANEAPIEQDRDIVVYRLSGAFFFGSAAAIGAILDRIGASPRLVVLDCSAAPVIDSTAARSLERFARKIDAKRAEVAAERKRAESAFEAWRTNPPAVEVPKPIAAAYRMASPFTVMVASTPSITARA